MWCVLIGLFGVLFVQVVIEEKARFELEFYRRCQRAGLGDTVKTKSEIQKAAEIARKMGTEKDFLPKNKKRHSRARWLNKKLCNGGQRYEQKVRAREVNGMQKPKEGG